ncbi:MAG: hypothetical protein CVU84_15190 [Firmicutes bacterium HGW-Firmicutes-1]|nr:MAG: hypothetical protein CVU84_15190 [Firmicutes bacterium HGW-Firmicutes-1]
MNNLYYEDVFYDVKEAMAVEEYEIALMKLNNLIEEAVEEEAVSVLIKAFQNKSVIYRKLGDFNNSIKNNIKAIEIVENNFQVEDEYNEQKGIALMNLAVTYNYFKYNELALFNYNSAIKLFYEVKVNEEFNSSTLIKALFNRFMLLVDIKDDCKIKAEGITILEMAKEVKNDPMVANIYKSVYELMVSFFSKDKDFNLDEFIR